MVCDFNAMTEDPVEAEALPASSPARVLWPQVPGCHFDYIHWP